MNFIADLHIHSHYSRATSKQLNFEQLFKWAQIKGITVVGTGDITHPGWLDEIKQKLADSEVLSPLNGRVSIKNMEQGEIAATGSTIVTVIDLKRPWVRVYIPEDKLGRVKLGMKAEIISDSFADKTYEGIIRYISPEAEFTPKNVQTQQERVKLVYAIKIYLDNPDQELKPGMPVDSVIRLEQQDQ